MATNFRDRVLELAEEADGQGRSTVRDALYFVASTMSTDQAGEHSELGDPARKGHQYYLTGVALGVGMAIRMHRKTAGAGK